MKVVEKFISIDGEGPTAGALSVFVRFAGCNLRCAWCDTSYAWDTTADTVDMTASEIAEYIKASGIGHVTITGGEPLLQPGLTGLLSRLADYDVHIETNGAIPVEQFRIGDNIHFVIDYKLPDSGMEERMHLPNLASVRKADAYKFVIASNRDLDKAVKIVCQYNLEEKTQVYFSTVFGKMEPAVVVERMKSEKFNGVKLQLQLHKFIWDPQRKGV